MPSNIDIAMPTMARKELTKIVKSHYRKHKVFSSEQDPTETLGQNFNKCFELAREDDNKSFGVMVVGSDDLINPDYFEFLEDTRPYYCDLGACYWYNLQTGEMILTEGISLGAGKYFSKQFLTRCDWKPYEDELNKNIDRGPSRFFDKTERLTQTKPWCIDMKGPGSLWKWSWVQNIPLCQDIEKPSRVFDKFGSDIAKFKRFLDD